MIIVVKMLIFINTIKIYWPQFEALLAGYRCFS